MTDHDEIRERLSRLDPIPPGTSIEPHDGPRARHHLEQIMDIDTETPPSSSSAGADRRRWIGLGAAAAVIVAALVAGGLALNDDGTESTPLALFAGSADTALGSCVALSPDLLAQAPVAFKGTVTAIEGDVVTLDVDEWYQGGDADSVQVTAVAGMGALIGEIDFQPGNEYLVSATDGTVNLCGFSGPATSELQAVYDQAFSG